MLCREGRTSSVWRHQKNGQRWNLILGFQVGGCGPSTPVAGRRAPAPTALPSQQSPFRKPRNAGMILCSDAGAAGKQLLFHSFFFHQSFCRALWEPEARHRNCSDSSADKTKLFYIFLWTFNQLKPCSCPYLVAVEISFSCAHSWLRHWLRRSPPHFLGAMCLRQ